MAFPLLYRYYANLIYIIKTYFNGNLEGNFNSFMKEYANDPETIQKVLYEIKNVLPDTYNRLINNYLLTGVADGSIGANDAYNQFTQYDVSPTEEATKYLDNTISQENTQADRNYQTEMRDTSLLSSGTQLQQLGLSPSGVISVGGASSGVSSRAADVNQMASGVNRKQQLAMNQYNQRMGMARSLIGMAGSMASSGIYGAAFGAAKHSASALAAAASHSGLMALKMDNSDHWYNKYDTDGFHGL